MSLGAVCANDRIIDLAAAAAAWLSIEQADPCWEAEVALRLPGDLGKLLEGGRPSLELLAAAVAFAARADEGIDGEPLYLDRGSVRLLQPLNSPLILSPGARFTDGPGADGVERLEHREFFMRNSINLPDATRSISLPAWLGEDFEVAPRLAVILGAPLSRASGAEASAALFGYCLALEIVLRDLYTISWAGPMFHVQYPHARGFDGSLLLADTVITQDEAGDVGARAARLTLDQACVFEGPLGGSRVELIEWICELSESVTLPAGTLLIPHAGESASVWPSPALRTPAEITLPKFTQRGQLRAGSRIALHVDGMGTLERRVR